MPAILDNPSLAITFVLRMILGGVFCWAGFSKFFHAVELSDLVARYAYIPAKAGGLIVRALPTTELALGIMFILGIWTKAASLLALLLLLLFSGWAMARQISRERLPCGCFGGWDHATDNRLIIFRNVSLIVAAGIVIAA